MNTSRFTAAVIFGLIVSASPAIISAQQQQQQQQQRQGRPPRPTPPARDPHTPGYVEAKELPDGQVPPPDADGNFIIGPTRKPAPEMTAPAAITVDAPINGASATRPTPIVAAVVQELPIDKPIWAQLTLLVW